MVVKDLFGYSNFDFDFDVCDTYDERSYIGFCSNVTALTDEAINHFSPILNNNIHMKTWKDGRIISHFCAIEATTAKEAQLIKDLFYSCAGYCDEETYNKWFIELY